jgi:hypothetical protein
MAFLEYFGIVDGKIESGYEVTKLQLANHS